MQAIGTEVFFGKRRGHVVGYTTFKGHGHDKAVDTYLVVELDPESQAYLEKHPEYDQPDCFIRIMVIHPESAHS